MMLTNIFIETINLESKFRHWRFIVLRQFLSTNLFNPRINPSYHLISPK